MFLPNKTYETVLVIAIAIIPLTMLFFSHVPTPYGRFYRENIWGPTLDEKNAWAIMEATGLVMFLLFYFIYGCNKFSVMPLVFLALWTFHYINRSIIYPYLIMKQKYKKFPLILVILGFFYLSIFAYLNAVNVSCNPKYTYEWLKSPAFIIGIIVFFIGFMINVWSDIKLRKNNVIDEKEIEDFENNYKFYEEGGFDFNNMFNTDIYYENHTKKHYQIPQGGLYEYISSPNYFGEIIEWSGWAIATWSLPGLLFALGAISCIGVRSLHTHRWYKKHYKDYPKNRKALIPFLL